MKQGEKQSPLLARRGGCGEAADEVVDQVPKKTLGGKLGTFEPF
jgi:hypothetical protein